ncbi:hypothetical protein, partial [Chlorobium limicola]
SRYPAIRGRTRFPLIEDWIFTDRRVLAVSPKLWVVSCGLLAGRAGIEEEEVAHGFARINTDWRLVCPALPFKSDAVFLGGKSAVPAD